MAVTGEPGKPLTELDKMNKTAPHDEFRGEIEVTFRYWRGAFSNPGASDNDPVWYKWHENVTKKYPIKKVQGRWILPSFDPVKLGVWMVDTISAPPCSEVEAIREGKVN